MLVTYGAIVASKVIVFFDPTDLFPFVHVWGVGECGAEHRSDAYGASVKTSEDERVARPRVGKNLQSPNEDILSLTVQDLILYSR
jgi:hypothetical protein